MVKFLASIPLIIGGWAVGAWFTMLTVGVIHADWFPLIPTIGYSTALIIAALTTLSLLVRMSSATAIKEMAAS